MMAKEETGRGTMVPNVNETEQQVGLNKVSKWDFGCCLLSSEQEQEEISGE